ncbi:MAG TPA: hypothetical protein DEA96_12770 [Leptospiraceae bacterium]|nr:hypothetical protein [Spirochaetaceae bacterium]HBS05835.1 hypothetical protein [Leptospiraceae bacterium]|tara:strand:- start:19117 stop:20337 length:1221 start_codon:yes stop_codon:yes gene_type:complete
MIRLILRQMSKYRWPILGLALVWLAAGYWLMNNRYGIVSFLASISTDFPDPGHQDSSHAYFKYVKPAMDSIEEEGIRLDLMKRACPERSERPFFEVNLARNHWLDKIRNWNIAPPGERPRVVEPEGYWKENREQVLESLQDLIHATYYAYEVTGEDRGLPGKETILIPALISRYAEALCMPLVGRLSWGDYVEFQEQRAYLELEKGEPEYFQYRLPAERDLLALGSLRNSRNYQEALLQYLGGGAPGSFSPEGCNTRSLVCLAPREAFQVYNKLIFAAPEERLPYLYLEQGQVLGWLARKGDASFEDPYTLAMDSFSGAARHRSLEVPARIEITRILVHTERYEEARAELRQISLIFNIEAPDAADVRELARKTLSAQGLHREADCFSEIRGTVRPHCQNRLEYIR